MLDFAKLLIVIGVLLIIIGVVIFLALRSGLQLGKLPGDILVERENFTCIFALGTSIFLSIVLTIVLNILIRLFRH